MSLIEKNAIVSALLHSNGAALAAYEHMTPDAIAAGLNAGHMTLLGNPAHKNVSPTLIGQPGRVKVNANIGTSPMINNVEMEIQKLRLAEKAGAHTVMDLSTAGDLDQVRVRILEASPLPLGTVPLYSVAQPYVARGQDPSDFSEQELFEEIEKEARQGVDFMTLHCGVTERGASLATDGRRILGIVSRGGSLLARWMKRHRKENPLLEGYDRLLDICLEHNVTISLGDGLRPGAGADAGDAAQWEEVSVLGDLATRALAKGVQIMIEGPGHVPLHLVASQIQGIKRLTNNAPLYVLGPLTTDAAAGYDHIAGAIGGAQAAFYGADFLCYLTPAEHVTLPGPEDVWDGVKASLIAAQSAETALGRPWAVERDLAISRARAALDWDAMAANALDPHTLAKRRKDFHKEKECAMCGSFCAIRMLEGLEPENTCGSK
uniref:Phosphomethylpyrimidine synthase n=1 Tax=Fundidesulfovibrio putealis TaxID=270496 RepID=A0A7C4A9X3_9BACT